MCLSYRGMMMRLGQVRFTQTIKFFVAALIAIACPMRPVRADIYQWQWVDPNDHSQGKIQSGTLCPAGAGNSAAPNANLSSIDLTMAYLIGADLNGAGLHDSTFTNADFSNANLTNANLFEARLSGSNFTGALIANVRFDSETYNGFTKEQLYSTASYQNHDIHGITFYGDVLDGWDFSNQNLTGASLRASMIGVNLSGANLTSATVDDIVDNANFNHANLTGAHLNLYSASNANFSNADLTSADLRYGSFAGANFRGANLLHAILDHAQFVGADLSNTDFTTVTSMVGAIFTQANLTNANLPSATFTVAAGANLTNANLAHSFLEWGQFDSATLTGANLSGASAGSANFSNADLRGANLTSVNFGSDTTTGASGAILAGANLSGAIVQGAGFTGVDLTGANLSYVNFAGAALGSNKITGAILTGAEIAGAGFSTSLGFTAQQLYSTDNYQKHNLQGVRFSSDNLAGWDFSNQDLTFDSFASSTLSNANFSGALITGARFNRLSNPTASAALSAQQLYSTASYQMRDLNGINFNGNDLSNWDLSGQNLTNTALNSATLTGTNFTAADLRGATGFNSINTTAINTILPDGSINGLNLNAGQSLSVRDFDGTPASAPVPVPITVNSLMTLSNGSTLSILLHDSAWGSTISFQNGITVALGGVLNLDVDSTADIHSLIGSPMHLFNWNSPLDSGNRFNQIQTNPRFVWDTSGLYTNGIVEIVHLFGDVNDDGVVNTSDLLKLAQDWQLGTNPGDPVPQWKDADFNGDGVVNLADLQILAQNWGFGAIGSTPSLSAELTSLGLPDVSVPEPAGLSILLAAAILARRRGN